MRDYVEQRNGGYYVAGTRLSLDSVVYMFKDGETPEHILQSFPAIGSLESVYGAVTFYLANQKLIDAYLQEKEKQWETARAKQPSIRPALEERLRKAVREAFTPVSE